MKKDIKRWGAGVLFIFLFLLACSPATFMTKESSSSNDCSGENCNVDPKQTPTPTPTPSEVTDTFTVPTGPSQVDILLVIDDSSSMSEDNSKLASRLTGFLDQLKSKGIDWQMCMTTTDTHYYNGALILWSNQGTTVLTPNSSNLNQTFSDTMAAVGQGPMDIYRNDERGIYAMNLAVRKDASRTHPCFRKAAALAVVLISDEDERSVGGKKQRSADQYIALTTDDQPDSFISTVKTVFNTDKKLTVNSIIVKDSLCERSQDAQGAPSFEGTFYQALSQKTNGYVGSICDSDYSSNLNYTTEKIVNSLQYRDLKCTPAATPTLVSVSPAISNLQLSVEGTQIKFDPVLPEGTTITFSYKCAP